MLNPADLLLKGADAFSAFISDIAYDSLKVVTGEQLALEALRKRGVQGVETSLEGLIMEGQGKGEIGL